MKITESFNLANFVSGNKDVKFNQVDEIIFDENDSDDHITPGSFEDYQFFAIQV